MASSKAVQSIALVLCLNLVFFNIASATKLPTCAANTVLDLAVCANLLGIDIIVGSPITQPCCSLIDGLIDLEAAVCLCAALKTKILGLNLDVTASLTAILNGCQKNYPSGYQCL